ncbi:MAG: hypothetical protein EP330_03775 [Deltaproteobacteria bacterium]|nr:MAG: hypothetical protein EP330_03775 [Deltaproteobacteria bacterium]
MAASAMTGVGLVLVLTGLAEVERGVAKVVEPAPAGIYTPDEIREQLKAVLPAVRACPRPQALGRRGIGFTVDASTGAVVGVEVDSEDAAFRACMHEALGAMGFPSRGEGRVVVRYPM